MVSRVQERVIQQGLRDPRAIAEGAGPSTSTLLGGACSPPTAHWFLLVGRGRQCVVTSIIRIGIILAGGTKCKARADVYSVGRNGRWKGQIGIGEAVHSTWRNVAWTPTA